MCLVTAMGTKFSILSFDLDSAQVRQGREEEMNNMVRTLGMFECES